VRETGEFIHILLFDAAFWNGDSPFAWIQDTDHTIFPVRRRPN
jgi:hypothetical protein